ncbi:hypothetical protein PTKIN_Ptkin15bG0062700 [Pterospermum kingtungense]
MWLLSSSFCSVPSDHTPKLLYTPTGKLFILQPSQNFSPPHPLIPPGNALYALYKTHCGYSMQPIMEFLNSPHPLDTLSDLTAYGSEGTILRDHVSSNYLRAVNGVLSQQRKMVSRRTRIERSSEWPLLVSPSPHSWRNDRSLRSSTFSNKDWSTEVGSPRPEGLEKVALSGN